MTTTWQRIEQAMHARGLTLKQQHTGEYRSHSPLRSDSDSNCFVIKVDPGGEHGTYYDHVSHDKGSLYDLADTLGVEKGDGTAQVAESKRTYADLRDYAESHGVPAQFMLDKGWRETTHHGRPALAFETATGTRYRFLDGDSPVYISEPGYTTCWYGLERAIRLANEHNHDTLVLCNGEISTLAGQHHGVPAFALTSGEKRIPDHLLTELNQKWSGRVILALDCDETGRKVATDIHGQVPHSEIVDMRLSDKGDLADFCVINTRESMPNLLRLSTSQNPRPPENPHMTDVNRSDKVMEQLTQKVLGNAPIRERAFPFPLKSLHRFGGFMKNCVTGKVTLIAGGTGTGKTQLLETFTDSLNVKGINGLWFGAEWSKEEMMMRRIQRYTYAPHVTYDALQEHLTYLGYEADGMPSKHNYGKKLSPAEIDSYLDRKKYVDTWTGTTEYFKGSDTLEDTFEQMRTAVERERRNNRLILFAVFDYVQLLKAKSWDNAVNRYEYAFECVKQFAFDMNLHVFMTSQVNKQASSESKGGKSLNTESAHYIRGDKANLFLILDRQYELDGYDNPVETNAFWLVVGKSSLGGLQQDDKYLRVPLVMHPKHLHFREEDWTRNPKYRSIVQHTAGSSHSISSNGNHADTVEKTEIPF